MSINIDQIRSDTPACVDKLFFNSAGASLVPQVVTKRMISYLEEEAVMGGYKLAFEDATQAEISEFYEEVAKMLNCNPRNVAYSISATDGFAMALSSISWSKNDIIISTDDDYISNHLQFSILYNKFGVQTVRVRNLENGELDLNHLLQLVFEHKPKLISVSHIPTNTGKVQNVKAVGDICEEHEILYIIDACQSVGQMPLDVTELKCDFLVSAGRKFLRAPRGTGFLYASDRILNDQSMPTRLDGRGAEWIAAAKFKLADSAIRFETWEQNYACVLGIKEAVKYANNIGLDNIFNYNQILLKKLISNFSSIKGVRTLDFGERLSNIFTFIIEGRNKTEIINHLDAHNVYYSVMSRGNALIDFDKKGVDWSIRLSPHYYNTMAEIDQISEIVEAF